MKIGFQAGVLLCVLHAGRVCASKDTYMQPELALARSPAVTALNQDKLYRFDVLDLLPEEYRAELLSLSQSLEVLENDKTPYCSGRVSSLLQRCTKDVLTPEDRDEAAMRLTLCDRARDYAPPMECEGFSSGADGADKASVKRCAIALDQHQNFQRTFDVYRILVIPEKCKSLNGIFNVDASRETYHNITLELIGFLQTLSRKEAKTEGYFAQWEDRLNAFQDATVDLSTVKRSLMDYNERFVDGLNGMMQTLNATFEGSAAEGRKVSEEISSELKAEIGRIGEEHGVSLGLVVASTEGSLSTGLKAIFDAAQYRQNNLDSVAALTVAQLTDAVNDLSAARQEFEALGVFVKEVMVKAYNQAFLLDKKQHDVSESLSGLGTEIRGLESTTRELNHSLTDIKDEAAEHFYFNIRQADAPWLKTVDALKSVLLWLGLSPFWALSFLVLSLPRFIVEQIMRVLLWFCAIVVSYAMKVVWSHRAAPNGYDAEKNLDKRWDPSMTAVSRSHFAMPNFQAQSNLLPQIAYTTTNNKFPFQESTNQRPVLFHQTPDSEVRKVLGEWALLRTRGTSRLPSRLYANSERTAEALARTRTQL